MGYLTTRPVNKTLVGGEVGMSNADSVTLLSEGTIQGIVASGGDLETYVKHNLPELTEEQQKDVVNEHKPMFKMAKAAM